MEDIKVYMQQIGSQMRAASRHIALTDIAAKNRTLEAIVQPIHVGLSPTYILFQLVRPWGRNT